MKIQKSSEDYLEAMLMMQQKHPQIVMKLQCMLMTVCQSFTAQELYQDLKTEVSVLMES